ncbi:porin [Paraburkholderia sp. UCT31]|uniref:porin n=1 Tax=Paraburkholderia sp. UCT31 TaxID=2615209 RepID=UPI001655A420|nr:porin [Paraburkholderia sp. UCT31]MBC8738579.1 porin [Paraburkholderia sp. UCT31]
MKKQLLAAAISSAASFGAFAQSSVTLYGTLDEGISYFNNFGGKSLVQAESGNLWGTAFGLKGTEDLGGGMKAVFQIESGFDINSGRNQQGGLMFGRTAFVGLGSDKAGTVTLGRQFDSASDVLGNYTSCWVYGGSGSHFGDNDNACQSARFNNAVKYVSPTLGGVTLGGMFALGNQTNFANNRAWSVALSYVNGPFSIGGGYLDANDIGSSAGPFDSAGIGAGFQDPSKDNYTGYMGGNYIGLQDAAKWKVAGIGTSYTIGKAVLLAEYTNTRYEQSAYLVDAGGPGNPLTTVVFNNYEVGALYNFTPAFSVNAAYVLSTMDLHAVSRESKFHIFQLLADYKLSKRTDLYALGDFQLAAGDAGYLTGGQFVKSASIQGYSTTSRQLMLTVGIRSLF